MSEKNKQNEKENQKSNLIEFRCPLEIIQKGEIFSIIKKNVLKEPGLKNKKMRSFKEKYYQFEQDNNLEQVFAIFEDNELKKELNSFYRAFFETENSNEKEKPLIKIQKQKKRIYLNLLIQKYINWISHKEENKDIFGDLEKFNLKSFKKEFALGLFFNSDATVFYLLLYILRNKMKGNLQDKNIDAEQTLEFNKTIDSNEENYFYFQAFTSLFLFRETETNFLVNIIHNELIKYAENINENVQNHLRLMKLIRKHLKDSSIIDDSNDGKPVVKKVIDQELFKSESKLFIRSLKFYSDTINLFFKIEDGKLESKNDFIEEIIFKMEIPEEFKRFKLYSNLDEIRMLNEKKFGNFLEIVNNKIRHHLRFELDENHSSYEELINNFLKIFKHILKLIFDVKDKIKKDTFYLNKFNESKISNSFLLVNPIEPIHNISRYKKYSKNKEYDGKKSKELRESIKHDFDKLGDNYELVFEHRLMRYQKIKKLELKPAKYLAYLDNLITILSRNISNYDNNKSGFSITIYKNIKENQDIDHSFYFTINKQFEFNEKEREEAEDKLENYLSKNKYNLTEIESYKKELKSFFEKIKYSQFRKLGESFFADDSNQSVTNKFEIIFYNEFENSKPKTISDDVFFFVEDFSKSLDINNSYTNAKNVIGSKGITNIGDDFPNYFKLVKQLEVSVKKRKVKYGCKKENIAFTPFELKFPIELSKQEAKERINNNDDKKPLLLLKEDTGLEFKDLWDSNQLDKKYEKIFEPLEHWTKKPFTSKLDLVDFIFGDDTFNNKYIETMKKAILKEVKNDQTLINYDFDCEKNDFFKIKGNPERKINHYNIIKIQNHFYLNRIYLSIKRFLDSYIERINKNLKNDSKIKIIERECFEYKVYDYEILQNIFSKLENNLSKAKITIKQIKSPNDHLIEIKDEFAKDFNVKKTRHRELTNFVTKIKTLESINQLKETSVLEEKYLKYLLLDFNRRIFKISGSVQQIKSKEFQKLYDEISYKEFFNKASKGFFIANEKNIGELSYLQIWKEYLKIIETNNFKLK